MRFFPAILLLLVLLAGVTFASGEPSDRLDRLPATGLEKIGAGVVERLAEVGQVDVVIALSPVDPPADGSGNTLATLQRRVAFQQHSVLATLTPAEYQNRLRYQAVPALVGRVFSASALAKLCAHPAVLMVDLDNGAGTGHLATSVPHIGADVWHHFGNLAEGTLVAVLDTGLETAHDDLKDDVGDQACFLDTNFLIDGIGNCPNGSDRQTGLGAAEDDAGHGTHVSGIITSKGTKSSVGVSPGAEIMAIKVLDNCNFAGCFYSFSEIVAALDYIITTAPEVEVINMSLGTNASFSGDCDNSNAWTMAGATAINTLRARGTVAFASAGNDSLSNAMGAPACLSNVISVGATTIDDQVAGFSNSSTTTDIMAPGVSIVSLGRGNTTFTATGTSMASPHAAGCAALLMNAGVTSPDQIETFLESSSAQVTDPKNNRTYPRIDCSPLVESLLLPAITK